VIVPVLNEVARLPATLASLDAGGAAHETIVVDGGSRDGSAELVAALDERDVVLERLAESAPRAAALNRGAARARGRVLLFLHADCRLPPGALAAARDAVAAGAVGGGFLKRYRPSGPLLALNLLWLNRVRTLRQRALVGTNAMFCERRFFESIGGFPEVALLEDVMLSDAMRRGGRVAILPGPVLVSARKYRAGGGLTSTLRNAEIMLRFRLLHHDPERLGRRYRKS